MAAEIVVPAHRLFDLSVYLHGFGDRCLVGTGSGPITQVRLKLGVEPLSRSNRCRRLQLQIDGRQPPVLEPLLGVQRTEPNPGAQSFNLGSQPVDVRVAGARTGAKNRVVEHEPPLATTRASQLPPRARDATPHETDGTGGVVETDRHRWFVPALRLVWVVAVHDAAGEPVLIHVGVTVQERIVTSTRFSARPAGSPEARRSSGRCATARPPTCRHSWPRCRRYRHSADPTAVRLIADGYWRACSTRSSPPGLPRCTGTHLARHCSGSHSSLAPSDGACRCPAVADCRRPLSAVAAARAITARRDAGSSRRA